MSITLEQLKKIAPTGRADLLQAIVVNSPVLFPQYGLTTKSRVAHFIAQIAHESDGFKTVVEYASGKAYEGRKDLGNNKAGDGVKYKGRGYIQLTGRANYTVYGSRLGLDLVNNPKLAEIPVNALRIALEYWKVKKLNQYADKNDILTITKRINGGTNGLSDRKLYLDRANRYIEVITEPVKTPEEVREILPSLNVESVEQFQKQQGLVVDGTVGPATEAAIEKKLESGTAQGDAKPSVTDVLKSEAVISSVAVTAGSSAMYALTASTILQWLVVVLVVAIFAWIAYKKIKEEMNG